MTNMEKINIKDSKKVGAAINYTTSVHVK